MLVINTTKVQVILLGLSNDNLSLIHEQTNELCHVQAKELNLTFNS